MRTEEETFVDRMRSLAKIASPEVVRGELEGVHPEDIAEALQRLEIEEGIAILQNLDSETAADVLVDLPTETARRFLAELPDETVAHYLDILPMDDALDLREELPEERFEALLNLIPQEDAQQIRRLMSYPEDSAGSLMTEAFFEVMPGMTMGHILEDIRRAPEGKYETVNDIYVLDGARHLLGVFSLRLAIRADPDVTASELMRKDIVTCSAWDEAEDVARQIARYGFYAMPVLDHRGRMLGIFTVDDAQEIIEEADTEDLLKLGGVSGDAEAYLSLSVWQLFKRRFVWLLVLFVGEFLTASVLGHYTKEAQEGGATTLAKLMIFIPLLIGAGGNSGSQVTTTITRALAVGDVGPRDALIVLRRELVVALVMGFALGFVGYMRAVLWGNGPAISYTVALALPAIIVWAGVVGSLLPISARRLKIDPAVMSAPFITTFVDATGLIIFFEIAKILIPFAFE